MSQRLKQELDRQELDRQELDMQESDMQKQQDNKPLSAAKGVNLVADEELSSLQSLVEILRKPSVSKCPHCFGRGQGYKGDICNYCDGSGSK